MLQFAHGHIHLIRNEQLRGDPTHTLTLRRAYSAQMTNRFRALKGVIRRSIIDNDALGLKAERQELQTQAVPKGSGPEEIKSKFSPIPTRRFAFTRSGEKIEGFMEWIRDQQNRGILEVTQRQQLGRAVEENWQNMYIRSSYQKGILRARQEARNAHYDVPDLDQTEGGLSAVFSQPAHADRVGAVYTRSFNELNGITEAMDQQISRELAQGLAAGDGPEAMARRINNRVDKVGLTRARTLARTETIRAHHVATIQEYRNLEVEGVMVIAEWSTAGDDQVCELCRPLEGQEFGLDTIEGMIPRHPNCRCVALPIDKTEVESEPEPEPEEFMKDPVALKFKDLAHGRAYYNYKRAYSEELDRFSDKLIKDKSKDFKAGRTAFIDRDIKELIDEDPALNKMQNTMIDWQNSTQHRGPMEFKILAEELEDTTSMVFRDSMTVEDITGLKRSTYRNWTDDEYLKIRAFNQAYMDKLFRGMTKAQRKKALTLYRGTDGRTGNKIRKMMEQEINRERKTTFPFKDSTLAGYSDKKNIANSWGSGSHGVTVRHAFNQEDIVIHRDLLSGVTGRYSAWSKPNEAEWIVKGLDQEVDIKDVKMILSSRKVKDFGEGIE